MPSPNAEGRGHFPSNKSFDQVSAVRPVRADPSTWQSPPLGGYRLDDVGGCKPFLHIIVSGPAGDIPAPRQAEYQQVLSNNLAYPWVKQVHIFWEGQPDIEWLPIKLKEKLVNAGIGIGRLSFLMAARYINDKIPFGEVVLLTNADIKLIGGFGCDSLTPDMLPFNTSLGICSHASE